MSVLVTWLITVIKCLTNKSRKDRLTVAHSSRVQSTMVGNVWWWQQMREWQELMAAFYIASAIRRQITIDLIIQLIFSFWLSLRLQLTGWYHPPWRHNLPTWINLTQKLLHNHVQRLASWVILDPVRLPRWIIPIKAAMSKTIFPPFEFSFQTVTKIRKAVTIITNPISQKRKQRHSETSKVLTSSSWV